MLADEQLATFVKHSWNFLSEMMINVICGIIVVGIEIRHISHECDILGKVLQYFLRNEHFSGKSSETNILRNFCIFPSNVMTELRFG